MRIGLVLCAAALMILAGGLDAAEARGRGFGRLFSGRAATPVVQTARPEGRLSRGPGVGLVVTPGRTVAVASAAALPIGVADLRLGGEASAATHSPAPTSPAPRPVQEARAQMPACAPGRRIGGLGGADAGFCLIN